MEENNCPFYGHHLARAPASAPPFRLIASAGNQCALVTTAAAPCPFTAPDWRHCERVDQIRIDILNSAKPGA